MKKKYQNKLYELSPDTYIVIPRFKYFQNRNLATKIHKSKKYKSRKRLKDELRKEIKEYLT